MKSTSLVKQFSLHRMQHKLKNYTQYAKKEAEIQRIQKIIFGESTNDYHPATKILNEPLNIDHLSSWYPPSKYGHLDFRIEQYLSMQAQRFSASSPHRVINHLRKTIRSLEHFNKQFSNIVLTPLFNPEIIDTSSTLNDFRQLIGICHPQETSQKKTDNLALQCIPNTSYVNKTYLTNVLSPSPLNKKKELLPTIKYRCPSNTHSIERINIPIPSVSAYKNNNETLPKKLHIQPTTPDDIVAVNQHREAKHSNTLTYSLDFNKAYSNLCYTVRARKELAADNARKFRDTYLEHPDHEDAKALFVKRNRFVDPVYLKNRMSFLMKKKKPIKKAEIQRTNHYRLHPDALLQYPVHKGPTFLRYPSVHK